MQRQVSGTISTAFVLPSYIHSTWGKLYKPSQTSKMELFAKKANGFQPLSIIAKSLISDVWLGSTYAYVSLIKIITFW